MGEYGSVRQYRERLRDLRRGEAGKFSVCCRVCMRLPQSCDACLIVSRGEWLDRIKALDYKSSISVTLGTPKRDLVR